MTLGSPISEVWENFSPTFSQENFANYNEIQQKNEEVLAPKNDYQPPKNIPVVQEKPTIIEDKIEKTVQPDISQKQNRINQELHNQIKSLEDKINTLINHVKKDKGQSMDFFGKNIHDILLFIILGIFILLVLDAVFRIVKMKKNL